jgi:hypothetical protein
MQRRHCGCAIFKDSMQTEVRNRIRNSKIVPHFIPKDVKNLSRQISYHDTPDERPLNKNDISIIKKFFPKLTIKKFRFVAVLSALAGDRARLEKINWILFKVFPFLRCFGDHVVLIAEKE